MFNPFDDLNPQAKPAKKSKYGNKKTVVFGIKFDSKKEAERYLYLRSLAQQGRITDLELQKRYELTPKMVRDDGKPEQASHYIADFVYVDVVTGKTIVEDVKGFKTDIYISKRKQMLEKYGISIKEV